MARILSLLVALVTSAAGQALLFWSQYPVTQRIAGDGPTVVGPALAALGGVLLLGITVLTAAWSSLGTWVVGLIEVVVGLAASIAGGPLLSMLRGLRFSPEATEGIFWYLLGTGLVVGAITAATGTAIRRRRRGAGGGGWLARLISLVVVLIAIGPATVLAVTGGIRNGSAIRQQLAGPEPLGLVLLLVGTLLLVLLASTVRWSGLGAIVGGAVVAVTMLSVSLLPASVGSAGLSAAPEPIVDSLNRLPEPFSQQLFEVLGSSAITAIGMLFLFGGIASVVAGRRVHHRATWVEPPRTEPEDAPASVLAPE